MHRSLRRCARANTPDQLKVKNTPHVSLKRRRHGIRSISTGIASNNFPMVTLNTRLGFMAQPAWITLRKEV